MKSSAKKVELASVDDLFSTEESRADAQRDTPRCAPRTHEILVHVGLLPAQLMVVVRRAHAVAVFV